MEMTRSILKHMKISNYLWGESVRHATYITDRAETNVLKSSTPYETFNGWKPNIIHLRMFRCVGYAKSDSPNEKKLDDRTRILVHLGTEPGSKAYRMLDPTTRKIIVSRDVVFDENSGWKWNNDGQKVSRSHECSILVLGSMEIKE